MSAHASSATRAYRPCLNDFIVSRKLSYTSRLSRNFSFTRMRYWYASLYIPPSCCDDLPCESACACGRAIWAVPPELDGLCIFTKAHQRTHTPVSADMHALLPCVHPHAPRLAALGWRSSSAVPWFSRFIKPLVVSFECYLCTPCALRCGMLRRFRERFSGCA